MGITQNIVVEQGATSRTALVYNHVVRLVCPVLVNASFLKCFPITVEIPDATTLQFKISPCEVIEVVTLGVSPIGSETITIQPYTGTKAIPALSVAKAAPVDLTGEVWRGACRKNYDDPLPLFTWDFTITPLIGLVVGTVPDDISSAIVVPKKERVIFSDIPKDFQQEKNFPPGVWSKAWFFDWEREFPNGLVERAVRGRLWMTVEYTK